MITSGSFWAVLGASVLVYWLLPKWREPFITLVSLVYLASLDLISVGVLVVWSGIFYFASQGPFSIRGKSRSLGFFLIAGALGTWGYFKYYPPLVFSLTSGETGASAADTLVPLGMSYFTFKLIGYMLDTVRGTMPKHTLLRFYSYMLFFPIFSAGPIERFEPFAKNDPRTFDRVKFGKGLNRIIFGLVKKLVVVDILLSHEAGSRYGFLTWTPVTLREIIQHYEHISTLNVWQFATNQFLTGYVDFSAYSDVAIGAALLFNYEIGENFDYPLFATNIGEFWKRWHISLSSWCQRYVYMPTIAKSRNPYLAMYATMVVMGLWHDASLNLLAWGVWQATMLCIFQTWSRFKRRRNWQLENPVTKVVGWAMTMGVNVMGSMFIWTNSVDLHTGFRIFSKFFGVT